MGALAHDLSLGRGLLHMMVVMVMCVCVWGEVAAMGGLLEECRR